MTTPTIPDRVSTILRSMYANQSPSDLRRDITQVLIDLATCERRDAVEQYRRERTIRR